MEKLILALAAAATLAAYGGDDWITAGKRWWAHIEFLASDALEGRNVGSPGYEKAADYVAREFRSVGLKPGGGLASYRQPVPFVRISLDESRSGLRIVKDGHAEKVTLGDQALLGYSVDSAPHIEAPLVFAGYGLRITEENYDDFAGLPLKGAVVVFLTGGPAHIPGSLRSHYSSAEERWKPLREAGAVGWISMQNPASMDVPWARQAANRGQARMVLADAKLAATPGLQFSANWNPARTDLLFAGTGHSMDEILKAAAANRPLPRFATGLRVVADVATAKSRVNSENLVGVRPGIDPALKNEYIVVSAHLDHLGVGEPVNGDRIFNGAMDDASGIASLIEIARALKDQKSKTRRSVVFLAVTGEEKGLLGSRYFTNHPTVSGRIVADINMDMFLPLFPLKYLEVQGLGESTLGDDIRAVAAAAGVEVQADKEPDRNRFIRSDQYSFIRKGVPALAFKFGFLPGTPEETTYRNWYAQRYHAVSDDLSQPVDKEAAAQFDALLTSLVERVGNADRAPEWKPGSFFKRFERVAQGK